MQHKNQIQQLIESKTGTNNSLALQLMQSLWHYSFEQALLILTFKKEPFGYYTIDLLDLKIEYLHNHNVNLDYIFIHRKIHYKNALLKGSHQDIYDGEPSDKKGFIKGLNPAESKAIVEDLKLISPIIEALLNAE